MYRNDNKKWGLCTNSFYRMDIPDGAEDPKRVSSDEKVAIEVAVSSQGDATEMGKKCFRTTSHERKRRISL